MHILWTIIIGFVAGLIARFFHPGKFEPKVFILTALLGIVGAFVSNIPWLGGRVVSRWRRRGFHRSNRRRDHSPGSLGGYRTTA
jgi:uncharacterized membrane protein YeaQ/YmgE (transglycosylase-associated protein family)